MHVSFETCCFWRLDLFFYVVINVKMVNLTLNGVQIDFPFKPYDVQEKFMESVIECLKKVSS